MFNYDMKALMNNNDFQEYMCSAHILLQDTLKTDLNEVMLPKP